MLNASVELSSVAEPVVVHEESPPLKSRKIVCPCVRAGANPNNAAPSAEVKIFPGEAGSHDLIF
jgi:hypothetical protein